MTAETIDELLRAMHFVEETSAKIHGLDTEDDIFGTLIGEFSKSERYCGAIFRLDEGERTITVVGRSLADNPDRSGTKDSNPLCVDLEKSSPLRAAIREGRTIEVDTASGAFCFSGELLSVQR